MESSTNGQALHLVDLVQIEGRPVVLRSLQPKDEPEYAAFLNGLDLADVHARFFNFKNQWTQEEIARLTRPDCGRELAFIACRPDGDLPKEILAEARVEIEPDDASGEFALVVRSDVKGRGLGYQLLSKVIRYCNARGIARLFGQVLSTNDPMLKLAQSLGFKAAAERDGIVRVTLDLPPLSRSHDPASNQRIRPNSTGITAAE